MLNDAPSTQPRVTCLVPAFNEGARIGAVLAVLTAHPRIDEVIVIDDASADDTAKVAASFDGVTVIRLSQNGGKTAALAAGLERAGGAFLLLIDADLIGLDLSNLSALIDPVLGGQADISLSLRRNAPRLWLWLGIDYITGERCLRRSLITDHKDALAHLPRFGFEVWLNSICITARTRITVVPWTTVDSPAKSAKFGLIPGILADIKMLIDIMRAIPPLQLLAQIRTMRALRV